MTPFRRFMKRLIDIVLSLIILFIISPLLIACAIAVKLESKGPIFFLQERVGKDGRLFNIYKFRTMIVDAVKKGLGYEILEGDDRITKSGNFLRRWSIDEFPQLLNVLKGEMSLVGPRPTLKYQVDQYDDFQRRRLEVQPGMTGLATVRGRNLLSWNERIEYDVWYVDNYSLILDFKIIYETFGTILRGTGVYAPTTDLFKIKPSGKGTGENEHSESKPGETLVDAQNNDSNPQGGGGNK
ncbi:MAG: sugar transferase [Firmicutes bacterium]|nr:sugar transferase [Bacillota bacterium]